MADQDWDTFMASTKEGQEEVETPETEEDETPEAPEVDPKQTPAKSTEDEEPENPENPEAPEKDPKGPEPAADEEDDLVDPKSKPDEAPAPSGDEGYKPRLTQFVDKDGKLDPEKIEKAYIESSKEAVRLANELKEQQEGNKEILVKIANDPDLAKAFFTKEQLDEIERNGGVPKPGAQPNDDPVRSHFEAQLLKTQREEYDDFVDKNPTATTDPDRAKKISEFIPVHRDLYRKENGGMLPSMKDTLTAAFRYHGWPLAEDVEQKESTAEIARKAKETEEALKAASRKNAAATKTPSQSKKAPAKQEFTKEQLFFAGKLGYTADDLKKSVKK